ncbi:pyridoxamine phosphate oxidase family protein [Microdochium bolleyi]|uniref:Pyridoxamine phosphate oxidase family protein n=1 Tax=Microdochium bolleyi TaxID=196109 RepID=A0A136J0K9_9PEZI|nr:pyridoxamine phosphate oxidase family protein [Microdochium bolleyi]
MGVFYEDIPPNLQEWIPKQKVFWVATAPLAGSGHVNVSPKGAANDHETFGLLDEKTFWYLDMTGSGSETISHLHEPGNGRITVMFNAFEGAPKIVRLWGTGHVLENGTEPFTNFIETHKLTTPPGTRSIITVDIHQVGSSCGYSVPLFDFKEHRDVLLNHFAKKVARFEAGNEGESMERYWAYKNAWSMDNLPAMKQGLKTGRAEKVVPLKKMVGATAPPLPTYDNASMLQMLLPSSLSAQSGLTVGHVGVMTVVSFVLGISLATYLPTNSVSRAWLS